MEAFEMSSEAQRTENRRDVTLNEKKVCDEPIPDHVSPLEDSPRRLEIEKEYPSGIEFILLTIGLMAVVLMVALDNYIVSTAIPTLTTQFNNLSLIGWYGSSYFLTLMSFQPAFGQLCTFFPVKTVCLISIAGFELGSIISAVAPNSVAFIVGRLISGAFGGGLWCGTLTLMAHAVPINKRHLYVSIVTSMYGVASAAGPLLGGVFTDSPRLTWRFCFWINLPIGLISFIIIAVYGELPVAPTSSSSMFLIQKLARLDIPGALLLLAAFVCLLLALQWGGTTFAWSDSRIWGCLLGFGLLIIIFSGLQVYLKDRATIPARIITKRTAAAGCLFTLFISTAIGVHVYYLPFYFQSVRGTTARRSGVETLPYLMSLLFTPMISGGFITIVGYYVPFMLVGCTLTTIGSGLLFSLSTDSSEGQIIAYQFLAAFGAGLCRQIGFSSVPLVLHPDDLATACALVAFCNSLGPTLAIAIGQSIFTNCFENQVSGLPGIDIDKVINQGAADLSAVVPQEFLGVVREAFNLALTRAFILPIVSGSLALCSSFVMEWISVKKKH